MTVDVLSQWWWCDVRHVGVRGLEEVSRFNVCKCMCVNVHKCVCLYACTRKLLLSPNFSGFLSLLPHPLSQNHPPAF